MQYFIVIVFCIFSYFNLLAAQFFENTDLIKDSSLSKEITAELEELFKDVNKNDLEGSTFEYAALILYDFIKNKNESDVKNIIKKCKEMKKDLTVEGILEIIDNNMSDESYTKDEEMIDDIMKNLFKFYSKGTELISKSDILDFNNIANINNSDESFQKILQDFRNDKNGKLNFQTFKDKMKPYWKEYLSDI
ncbi:uncharacterized protein LOC126898849 [Daktulosphaira vitifoliae]|uniref:uncharacterized protein LOC126898849 n=1 Tax=Daktulosphaira vitifoliae TaxID=58002 RepID=UPI0021A9AD74|nr:uncharacterized protein LOC126898849 [Daktulosphaira vitifoliae]